MNSSGQYVFQLNVFFYVSAVAELMERIYSRVVLSSLFRSELLNQNIKQVRYVLTHYRKE